MNMPAISVVVIGRNEGQRLVRCLETIRHARYDGIAEVIYVDSDSKDGSPQRAAALGARVIAIRPERPTAAIGRNAGWRAATSPLIFFLDGDTLLDPDFLQYAVDTLDDPTVAVVFGNRREMRAGESVYNRVLDLDWVSPAGRADYCGGDAVIRRSALESVQGYDESLIAGEEPDMCRRMRGLGASVLHIDVPMTLHDLAMLRWSQYWRRAVRTGYAYAEVSARYRNTPDPLWFRESNGNRTRGSVLLGIALGALLVAVMSLSATPLLLLFAFWTLLVVRTERRIRWKSRDAIARLLYATHSHVQQIPILIGQWQYFRDCRNLRKRPLIEYKEAQQ